MFSRLLPLAGRLSTTLTPRFVATSATVLTIGYATLQTHTPLRTDPTWCDNSETTSRPQPQHDDPVPQTNDAQPTPDENVFNTVELQQGLERRKQAEEEVHLFSRKAKNRMFYLTERFRRGDISERKYKVELKSLKEEILLEFQRISYGVTVPHARQQYLEAHGCTRCTEEAVAALQQFSPLVELGAGSGHWNKTLAEADVDIISYDNMEHIPEPAQKPVGNVQVGDETTLKSHPDRTLLLVYPSPGPMATRCLKQYHGQHLVYVGEGERGCNADQEFFEIVKREFHVQQVVELDPFPECFEKMYVLKRKQESGGWTRWLKFW